MDTNEELIERIDAAIQDRDNLHHVKMDKELVAAANEALRRFSVGCKDWTPGILMGHAYLAGFFAGADWQRDRKPLIGEDHED